MKNFTIVFEFAMYSLTLKMKNVSTHSIFPPTTISRKLNNFCVTGLLTNLVMEPHSSSSMSTHQFSDGLFFTTQLDPTVVDPTVFAWFTMVSSRSHCWFCFGHFG
jgi:hypothetical protein